MPDEDLLKKLCAFIAGSVEWNTVQRGFQNPEELIRLSSAHGLNAVIFHLLSKISDGCKANILELLRPAVVEETQRSLVQVVDIQALADHLTEKHIPFLLIKGVVLAHLYFPSPNLRPRADTDIFIDQDNIVAARNWLCGNGYRCEPLVTPLRKGQFLSTQFSCRAVDRPPGHPAFDLHWKINNSSALGGLLSFDDLYACSIPLEGLGHGIRVPTLPFSLIIACIHWIGEPNKRLIWLYDIHVMNEFMESRDWDLVINFAVENKSISIIQKVLEQTIQWFETDFPPEMLERLDRIHAERPKETLQLLTRTSASAVRDRYVDFLVLPWRQRLTCLWTVCFPPKSYLMLQNPKLTDISRFDLCLFYIARPFRYFARHKSAPTKHLLE